MNQTRTQKNLADSLKEYERLQAEIKRTLKQIEIGLIQHDSECSARPGGHTWASCGDLEHYQSQLKDIRDSLLHQGEYAEAKTLKTYRAYNSQGQAVKVTVPED